MLLKELLARKKKEIKADWFKRLIDTYPAETVPFFKKDKDPFSNPVGGAARRGIDVVIDELLGEMDIQNITSALDPIIRIRALQAFTPSQATGFIFMLKNTLRECLEKEISAHRLYEELLAFEVKIDKLILIGFNIYMECREKIAELQANELKDRTFKAFERAGLVEDRDEKTLLPFEFK